jgi:arsenite-transporting ATPase
MRVIFYAGKGGVGKTSVSAATGIKAAEMGMKTIVMSLDIAHSLSDIFDIEEDLMNRSKGKPVQVSKNLSIQEIDIQEEIEKNWGEIYRYISALLNNTGLDEVLAEELAILPGMEEVSLLLYINRYVRQKSFDVIILDCAPTGESLRFISIPTALEWYITKIFKIEKTMAKVIGPMAKRIYDLPIPDKKYFDAIEYLFERLQGVDKILADPETTSVRLVTNPEKVVLKETQRAFMYFSLNRIKIDGIIMNRVLPDTIKDEYFKDWRQSQKNYIGQAGTYFDPVPILSVNLFKDEILGYESLRLLGDEIYGARNPLDHFIQEAPYSLVKENGGYRLSMKLPFLTREDVELNRVSDELIIRVGGFKRHLILPRQVAASKSIKAKMEDQHLSIFFKGDDNGKRKK